MRARSGCSANAARHEELPLYISHRHDRYVLARWPGSGARHATACDHYEAPDFLTGMGQVRGKCRDRR
jgi:hypothetical protein